MAAAEGEADLARRPDGDPVSRPAGGAALGAIARGSHALAGREVGPAGAAEAAPVPDLARAVARAPGPDPQRRVGAAPAGDVGPFGGRLRQMGSRGAPRRARRR